MDRYKSVKYLCVEKAEEKKNRKKTFVLFQH